MVFHWSLRKSKVYQVYSTLLNISATFKCHSLDGIDQTSSFFRLFSMPLGTILKALTTTGIIVTFIFKLSCSLARSRYLSTISFSFVFTLWFTEMAKYSRWQVLFFWLSNTRSCLLAKNMVIRFSLELPDLEELS